MNLADNEMRPHKMVGGLTPLFLQSFLTRYVYLIISYWEAGCRALKGDLRRCWHVASLPDGFDEAADFVR